MEVPSMVILEWEEMKRICESEFVECLGNWEENEAKCKVKELKIGWFWGGNLDILDFKIILPVKILLLNNKVQILIFKH